LVDTNIFAANGWQEIDTSGVVGYFRLFSLVGGWQQELQCTHGIVLVSYAGVEIYPPMRKAKMFVPRQVDIIAALDDESVSVDSLARYVVPESAAIIYGMFEQCRTVHREACAIWRYFLLAGADVVLAKNFTMAEPLKHMSRSVAVVLSRNGIGLHQKPLQDRNPPQREDCVLFIPSRRLSAETLRKYFSSREAAEIIAIYKRNRDQLLHFIRGGKDAECLVGGGTVNDRQ